MHIDSSNIVLWGVIAVLLIFMYRLADATLGKFLANAHTRRMYRKSIEQAEAKLKENASVDNFEAVQGVVEQFRSNVELIRIKETLECLSNEQELIKEIDEHERLVKALFSIIRRGEEPSCLLAKNYLNKTIESSLLLPNLLAELEFLCDSAGYARKKDVELLLNFLRRINAILKQVEWWLLVK